jgi:hypothetical protein
MGKLDLIDSARRFNPSAQLMVARHKLAVAPPAQTDGVAMISF